MRLERHVLIVEDETEVWRRPIQAAFPFPDWQITFADTATAAISLFKEYRDFDLILVDFKLKGNTTGGQFLKELRALDRTTPALLFSQHGSDGFSAADVFLSGPTSQSINKEEVLNNPMRLSEITQEAVIASMAGLCKPQIRSEHGRLRSMIVHTPSLEMERMDPECLGWYLFESRPDPVAMQEQHLSFLRTIKECGDPPVILELGLLLYDVVKSLSREERKELLVRLLLDDEVLVLWRKLDSRGLPTVPVIADWIDDLAASDPRRIVLEVLGGLSLADVLPKGETADLYSRQAAQVICPVPNLYFTRDPAFVLGERLILSRMHWPVRRREVAIVREVISNHPFMREAQARLVDWPEHEAQHYFIEGGDAMAVGDGVYAVAESERTNRQAIRYLVGKLFEDKGTKRVYQPSIPQQRSFIHLDTVCSLVGKDYVLVYPDAFKAYQTAETVVWERDPKDRQRIMSRVDSRGFLRILETDFNRRIIEVGGGGPDARGEQFDDAANVFMTGPEQCITYERNFDTNVMLKGLPRLRLAEVGGSELVVGRGGPRCMTMALRRE